MSALDPILQIGSAIITRLWPDPAKQAEAQLHLLQLQQNGEFKDLDAALQLALAQIGVNQTDASSASNYRGGWRPFIGWVCGFGLAYQFLARPLLMGIAALPMPELDITSLFALVSGLLGLGVMRTTEKLKGIV